MEDLLTLLDTEVPDGNTPLAGAYCDGVDQLAAYRTPALRANYALYLRLYSDGEENATTDALKCHGRSSASQYSSADQERVELACAGGVCDSDDDYISTADGLQVPSWQSNMLDRAATGVTHEADATGGVLYAPDPNGFRPFQILEPAGQKSFIVNITFLNEFIGSTSRLAAARPAHADEPPGGSSVGSASVSAVSAGGLAFFRGLAEVTGGRLIVIGPPTTPGDPTAPHVVPGDADNSGCVDLGDFNLVKQYYGHRIANQDPQSYAADINYDGSIDLADYLMLQATYGSGCATPPGPLPVLQQVLFGFDSLANWSSPQAPMSLASNPRTEGRFAMSVEGSGLRVITTSDLDTSIFQGVTSNLELDLAPPTSESNHRYVGQVMLLASCPSAYLYYFPLGVADLTGKPLGQYSTFRFAVPRWVRQAMLGSHPDFSFTIVLNAHDPGFLLDNLRFVP